MNSRFFVALSLSFLATSVSAQEVRPAPEPPSGVASKSLVVANRQLVVAAEPAAAEAGREILRKGGSAVDAAIATELVLGLVEPQSSGLGGGAFLSEENFDMVFNNGVSVWLDCPFSTVERRVAKFDHRPLARDPEKLRELFAVRRPGYERADYCIPVESDDAAVVAAKILELPLF